MENERHYFKVGLFVLGGLIAAAMTLVWFSPLGTSKLHTTYAIYFTGSVSGLTVGAPVQLKGLNVGRVSSVQFQENGDDKIRVLTDIVDSAPIRSDTVATIRLQGITGNSIIFLENTGKTPKSEHVVNDDRYPVIQSTPSELEKFFEEFPKFADKIGGLADRTEKLLSDENIEALNMLLVSAAAAMGDVSALTTQARSVFGNQTNSELQATLTEAKLAMREIKMLARSLREDPSKILRSPSYQGERVDE